MLCKIPKTEMLNKETKAIDKLSVKQALKVLVKDQQNAPQRTAPTTQGTSHSHIG